MMFVFFLMIRRQPRSKRTDTLFPYTTLFRSDIDHHAALEPARFVRADPDHLDRVAGGVLADQRHHLGGADVESDDECLVAFAVHVWGPGLGLGDWGFGKAGKLADQGVRGIRAAQADRTRCPSPNAASPSPNPCSSRSEEHTSERPPRRLISYAVSCVNTT